VNAPGPYVVATIALVGFALFAAIHHAHLWLFRKERSSLLFAACCVPVSIVCVAHAAAAMATTVDNGQLALDLRTTFGLLSHLAVAWFVASISGVRAAPYLLSLTVLMVTGVAVNTFVFPLVGTVVRVDRMTLPWGEEISMLSRETGTSWLPPLLYAGVASVQIYALLGARALWRSDRTAALLMALAGCAGLLASAIGWLIDTQAVRGPYIGQLSVAIWIILMAMLLSGEHARRADLLEASDRRFRAIFDQTFQFIGLMATDGRLVEANRTALQFAGIREEDVIGKPFWTTPWWTHSAELQKRLRDAVARAASGETVRFEATHRRQDGQLAYVDFSLKPVRDEQGAVTLLIPEGHDVTERKRAELALSVSEARYRTLIEFAPEAIVVLDVERRCFTDLNQQACALFGLSAAELKAMDVVALSPPVQPDGRESRIAAWVNIEKAVNGETPVFEWTHRTPGGRDIPCEVRLVRLPDPGRTLVRGSITDISGRVQLQAQLRQSQKMEAIGQLAGGVAHDFNNLLTVISGYAELLQQQLGADDPRSVLVDAIQDGGRRAAWLTERLLAFSRRAVLSPKVMDLNRVVLDAEAMLRRLIGVGIELTVQLHAEPNHVRIDPGLWSQVLLNLAVNARDAMPQGGRLEIVTRPIDVHASAATPERAAGRYIQLSVSDTGCGMPPEVISRIFEPFFTTKQQGKGTGLGLAVVHGIVTQAGGFIDVVSTPGVGTTFKVHVPVVADDAAELASQPETSSAKAVSAAPVLSSALNATARARSETILLVEDSEGVRLLIESALRPQGFGLLVAHDGREALQILDAHQGRIDLLISDVVVPGVDGFRLGQTARARNPKLKSLYISGQIDGEGFLGEKPGNRQAFLPKPFSLASLTGKIRELLDAEAEV
jgi:two-component system cell cycle sensor histidine kinase/response regulator CckA